MTARAAVVTALAVAASHRATAAPQDPPVLVALAPADDARRAVAIGPAGEVYAPDGQGAWIRTQRIATADTLALAGRAGGPNGAVVALGEGVIYRLAANGWSAIRLAQKGKAIMSTGARAIAAVGRQLYSLDTTVGGEPAKLGLAAGPVLAIGSGRRIVIQTDRGLFAADGARLTAIKNPPRRIVGLVNDQWALVDHGVVDLRSGTTTMAPAGVSIGIASVAPDDRLVAVGTSHGKLELVTVRAGRLDREPIEIAPIGVPVGLVFDRSGRVVVALRDGRLALRTKPNAAWTTAIVGEQLADPRPGRPPATSP